MSQNQISYKLVLLGDSAVGKSSVVGRYVKNEFLDFEQPTIGAAFLTQTVKLATHKVKFEIWDTAGQERYRSLAPMYYKGAGAALVVYDITDTGTYDGAKKWITELQRQGDPDIIIALAGNKCDLELRRKVRTEEAKAYADENSLLFLETSAKTGENVDAVFRNIATKLPAKHPSIVADEQNIMLVDDSEMKRGCC